MRPAPVFRGTARLVFRGTALERPKRASGAGLPRNGAFGLPRNGAFGPNSGSSWTGATANGSLLLDPMSRFQMPDAVHGPCVA